jgi:bacterioferritin-associated ferredoxin
MTSVVSTEDIAVCEINRVDRKEEKVTVGKDCGKCMRQAY